MELAWLSLHQLIGLEIILVQFLKRKTLVVDWKIQPGCLESVLLPNGRLTVSSTSDIKTRC